MMMMMMFYNRGACKLEKYKIMIVNNAWQGKCKEYRINPFTPELNVSEQRYLPRFFTGDFKF